VARHVGRLADSVSGYLAGSITAGEALSLSLEDRLAVLSAVAGACGPDQPLLFEITGRTVPETEQLLSEAELVMHRRPGRDLHYLLTPLIYHGNRDLPDHLRRLGRLTRRNFILATRPDLVGRLRSRLKHHNIRTAFLKKMSVNDRLAGLSHEGALSRALNYQRAVKTRSGFRFYDGAEAAFLDSPSSSGVISCGANVLPSAWSDVVNSSLNVFDSRRLDPGHFDRIWRSGQAVRLLLSLYESDPPGLIREALRLIGRFDAAPALDNEPVRAALVAGLRDLHLI
jgi:dihydrodipicolinate synthase/N-acetylneuraminate lyase